MKNTLWTPIRLTVLSLSSLFIIQTVIMNILQLLQIQSMLLEQVLSYSLGGIALYLLIYRPWMHREEIFKLQALLDESKNMLKSEICSNKVVKKQLSRISQVVEQSQHGIIITNPSMEIEYINKAFTEITGYTLAEVRGKKPNILKSGKTREQVYRDLSMSIANQEVWSGEFVNVKKDGKEYISATTIFPVFQGGEKELSYVGFFEDITTKKSSKDRINFLAHFDSLTGLPNRDKAKEIFMRGLALSKRCNRQLALLFIDLDRFKEVNDTMGHDTGDLVLIEIARRMSTSIREIDTVSRISGDEFIVIIPETDVMGVEVVAQKILDAIAIPLHINQHSFMMTGSVGVAFYSDDGCDFESLVKSADLALYQAKQDGRNLFRHFTLEMKGRSQRYLSITRAMEGAIESGQFYLNYQPQIDLATEEIVGLEALLRWENPSLGPISPAEFIPFAEKNGHMLAIGEWVLQKALEETKEWVVRYPDLRISVNISAVQFKKQGLFSMINRLLLEYNFPPKNLKLELTESTTMDDPLDAKDIMDALHAIGVSVSIDDFGTGYSSLTYLKQFHIDQIKIDRSFITNIVQDEQDRAISKMIINLAHSMGSQVVAEGVEDKNQLDLLNSMGCDLIQGYYFGKPESIENTTRILLKYND